MASKGSRPLYCLLLFSVLFRLVEAINMSFRIPTCAIVIVVAITLTSCAQTTALKHTEKVPQSLSGKRVLLMPSDIELSELTMGGMLEPKADWTDLAQKHVGSALQKEMDKRKTSLAQY